MLIGIEPAYSLRWYTPKMQATIILSPIADALSYLAPDLMDGLECRVDRTGGPILARPEGFRQTAAAC